MSAMPETSPTNTYSIARFLPGPTQDSLDQTLQRIPQGVIEEFIGSLENHPFTNPSVWNPERHQDIQLVSYKAFQQGRISLDQFATCSLVSYAFEQFQQNFIEIELIRENHKKPIQLVKDKEPEVLDSTFTTIEPTNPRWNETLERMTDTLHYELNDDIDRLIHLENKFKEKLKDLPSSEQVLFSYTFPSSVRELTQVSPMLKVLKHQKLPFFIAEEPRENEPEKNLQITFMSYLAFKTLLDTFNPEGMKPELVFGKLNTIQMRRFFLDAKTPVNLPFFEEPIIKEGEKTQSADGHLAGPFGFAVHDLYHVWLKNRIKTPYLEASQEVVDALIAKRAEYKVAGYDAKAKRLGHDAWLMVDMDLNRIDLSGNPFRFILLFISDEGKEIISELVLKSENVRKSIEGFDHLL